MTETDTTLATIDDVLNDGTENEVTVTDAVDAEVVSDVTEATAEAPARRTRKSKAQRGQEQQGEAREVAAPAPVEEKSSFTRAKAVKHTEKLRGAGEVAAELFVEAYNGRIWLAFGDTYSKGAEGWREYLNAELGEVRPRLPKAQRLELVGSMKSEAKMSQQAIADALGVDQKTVSNDLRELRGAAAEAGEEEGDTETVSLDGSVRTTPRTNNRKQKAFIDRVTGVVDKLDKAVGDLTDLTVEDEWTEEVSRIAGRHRADLARWVATFQGLLSQFDQAPEWEEPVEATEEAPAE